MALHLNDAAYFPLVSCKKLEILMTSFRKMSKNLNFWHLIPLNPQIKIFSKYGTTLKWNRLLPSTIMQKIRNI